MIGVLWALCRNIGIEYRVVFLGEIEMRLKGAEMLSKEQIAEIEQRAEKATLGAVDL